MPTSTPRELGYRMPAEWEPHEATWLAWPHNPEDWPGKFQAIPWLYAEIVRLLAARERVHLLVQDEKEQRRATGILERAGRQSRQRQLSPVAHRSRLDARLRSDLRPQARKGRVALTNWRFNGWAKYADWHLDDQIPGRAAELLGLAGSGSQTIKLAGRAAQTGPRRRLHRHQRPGHSADHRRMPAERSAAAQSRASAASSSSVPSTTILASSRSSGWGAALPATTPMATWTTSRASSGRRHIVTAVEPNTKDPNHEPLAENLARLKAARTADGKQFTVVELPLPRPVVFRGQRLPASYANFYIANGLVLVPTFHDPNDRVALEYPRRVVSGSRSHRHPRRRSGLGPRHAALHDPAAACLGSRLPR